MNRIIPAFTLLILFVISCQAFATQQPVKRFALVIGNNAYARSPLENAVNDAKDISEKLISIGFQVTTVTDASRTTLHKAIKQFYREVELARHQKVIALFYYAGHAVQIKQRNYLLPVDFTVTGTESKNTLFDINLLLEKIPARNSLSNIIILDACRNNPFENHEMLSGDGLAPIRAPSSTLIAYSTEPGNVALDGRDRNGTYTQYLLQNIDHQIPVEEMFRKVRKSVAQETANQQIPWEHSSLVEEIFLNPPVNRNVPDLLSF